MTLRGSRRHVEHGLNNLTYKKDESMGSVRTPREADTPKSCGMSRVREGQAVSLLSLELSARSSPLLSLKPCSVPPTWSCQVLFVIIARVDNIVDTIITASY